MPIRSRDPVTDMPDFSVYHDSPPGPTSQEDASEPGACVVVEAGSLAYDAAVGLQKRLHDKVVSGGLPGALLLLEHPHVFTLGRRGRTDDILVDEDEIAALGAAVRHTDRGGEVTYHGPGQLVGYPIVDLRRLATSPLEYVRRLERVLIETLADFGIRGESEDRPTGVWVGKAKIAAIGVRISRGVTTHGFALNVDPDLTYFDRIVPCGMRDVPVTSMAAAGASAGVSDAAGALTAHFAEIFGVDVESAELYEVMRAARPPGEPTP